MEALETEHKIDGGTTSHQMNLGVDIHRRLLVVDDEEVTRRILRLHLGRAGYSVTSAENGMDAIVLLRQHDYDLVILDIAMPKIDGLEVLKHIRRTYSPIDLPVIMVTAKTEVQDAIEALKTGANDYVTKPFAPAVLIARVQSQLLCKSAADIFRENERRRRRLDAMQNDFFNMVVHEMNSPLAAANAALTFFVERNAKKLAGPDAGHLNIVLRNLDRLSRLSTDLLDIAKMESGAWTVSRRKSNLGVIIRSACETLNPLAEKQSIGLKFGWTDTDSAVWADVDPARIEQAIINLVHNAIRFASRVVRVRLESDSRICRIAVEDDGPGIEAHDLPHIFNKFYKGARKPEREKAGSGLGLAIVKGIAEAHGGTVEACNIVDEAGRTEGARLTLALPLTGEKASA